MSDKNLKVIENIEKEISRIDKKENKEKAYLNYDSLTEVINDNNFFKNFINAAG